LLSLINSTLKLFLTVIPFFSKLSWTFDRISSLKTELQKTQRLPQSVKLPEKSQKYS
jgi:hypothetical protein